MTYIWLTFKTIYLYIFKNITCFGTMGIENTPIYFFSLSFELTAIFFILIGDRPAQDALTFKLESLSGKL